MKLNLLYYIIITVLTLNSCKKDPDPVLPDFPWDCDYDIGTYELLPSSYAKIPYEGKQKVVFRDSLGNEITFTISTLENLHEKSHFTGSTASQPDIELIYCFYADSKEYLLTNDSLKMQIQLTLYASPFHSAPLDHLIGDHLSISVQKATIYSLYATYGIFNATIDQRTFPYSFTPTIIDSISFFNKAFYNVQFQAPFLNFTCPVYYNSSEGVVSFLQIDGKKWRFDRFE